MKLIIVKKSNSGYTVEFDQELTDSPEDDQDAFVADAIAALEDKLMSLRYDLLSWSIFPAALLNFFFVGFDLVNQLLVNDLKHASLAFF